MKTLYYLVNNKIIDVDCYQDEEITKQLKSLIVNENNICENLVVFNQYFESIDVDTSSDSSEEIKNAKFKIPNQILVQDQYSKRFLKLMMKKYLMKWNQIMIVHQKQ